MKTEIKILINGVDSGTFTITGGVDIESIAVVGSGIVDILKEKLLKK